VELIDFVDLTSKEKLMILSWRNDEDVKKCNFKNTNVKIINNKKVICMELTR
jgi:hypothetical protein